jgi:tetratricopeptide (TPR) repeat protein
LQPLVIVVAVAAGVWWYVARESAVERGTRLIAEARRAMEAGDLSTAETKLQAALRDAPRNGVLLHNLGVLYVRQNRLPEARAVFERAAAAHGPEASKVRAEELFQLATLSYREKQWSRAAAELQQAIAADPTRAQLHARLLDLQLGPLQDPAAAESTTARFLRLCGRTGAALGDAAYVHLTNKSYVQAESLGRAAVARADSNIQAHAVVAHALLKTGRVAAGLDYLKGPLARYPKAADLWVSQALLLLEGRGAEAGLAAAERAVALAPQDFEAHQTRQKALAALGRYQDALREIEVSRSLTDDPGRLRMLLTQQRILRSVVGGGGLDPVTLPTEPSDVDSTGGSP